MKKILLSILALLISNMICSASTNIKVEAMENFNTAAPSQVLDVKVLNDTKVNEHSLKSGSTLRCKVVKIVPPKRGKRNASFYLMPYQYVDGWNVVTIQNEYIGKYSKSVISKEELKNLDKGKAVKGVASTVGGYFVKGLGQGISFTQGVIQNEEGNRLVSGVEQVYKDSPLSYIENGNEVEIKTGDIFYLKFKSNKDNDDN